jgi:hypothetical protein
MLAYMERLYTYSETTPAPAMRHGRRFIIRTVVGPCVSCAPNFGAWRVVAGGPAVAFTSTVNGRFESVVGSLRQGMFSTRQLRRVRRVASASAAAARVMPRSERGLLLSQRSLNGTSSSACKLPVCRSGDNCNCKFGVAASSLPVRAFRT